MQPVTPIPRDLVVENMSDLMLVLNEHDQLVDFNPAAQQALGLQPSAIGQSIDIALSHWAELADRCRGNRLARAEISLGEVQQQEFYDLTIRPIQDRSDRFAGRLILLRDITERK